jgi:hypothetical protein
MRGGKGAQDLRISCPNEIQKFGNCLLTYVILHLQPLIIKLSSMTKARKALGELEAALRPKDIEIRGPQLRNAAM